MQHSRMQMAAAMLEMLLLASASLAAITAIYVRFYSGLMPVTDLPDGPIYAGYYALSFALWVLLGTRSRLIRSCFTEPSLWAWGRSVLRLDLLVLAGTSLGTFFWRGYSFSRYTVIFFWTLHLLLSLAAGWVIRWWVRKGARDVASWVVLIGDASLAEISRKCLHAGGRVVTNWVPDVDAAVTLLRCSDPPAAATEIITALKADKTARLAELAEALERLPLPGALTVEGWPVTDVVSSPPLIVFSTGPKAAEDPEYIFAKRFMDAALAVAGMVLLAPVLLGIAAAILVGSGRPVLISQERVGRGGKRFRLLKFRSLPAGSLPMSDRQWTAAPTDSLGRFLRRTGLDELPQLVNVLKGDMSLVGPRPERPVFVEEFRKQLPFYVTRHRLQCGITGWAQVNGWRGDTSIARRIEHDLYYMHHWSLGFDLRILWMTLLELARQLWDSAGRSEGAAHARSV